MATNIRTNVRIHAFDGRYAHAAVVIGLAAVGLVGDGYVFGLSLVAFVVYVAYCRGDGLSSFAYGYSYQLEDGVAYAAF